LLISNFRHVLNVVYFLLGLRMLGYLYPNIWGIYTPIFSTPVIIHNYPPMKMEQTECSEMLAYKIQPPGN